MSQTHPPRFVEGLLESFGATAAFRDGVIGDLAQEYALRVERHGARVARYWYYRQAAMATPHLLRSCIAGATLSDVGRLLNVAALSFTLVWMTALCAFFGTVAVVLSLRTSEGPVGISIGLILMVALGLAVPVSTGYLAAALEESRPMVASLAVAFAWAALVALASWVVYRRPGLSLDLPLWLRLLGIPMLMAWCVAGGAIRISETKA